MLALAPAVPRQVTACWNHLLATIVSGWSSRAQAPVRRHPDQRLQGRRRGNVRRGRLRPHRPDHLRRGDRGAGPGDVRGRQPALPAPLRVSARLGRARASGAAASGSRPCSSSRTAACRRASSATAARRRRRRSASSAAAAGRANEIEFTLSRTAPSYRPRLKDLVSGIPAGTSTARSRAAVAATATRGERPATRVLEEVRNGVVSLESARGDYGVVDRPGDVDGGRARDGAPAGHARLRAPQPAPAARDWRKRSISTRQDEHGSRDHVLVVDVDARDDQAVLEDAEEEDAEERAEHRADAADEARAAEQDGGGGRELDPGVGVRRRGGEAAGLEEAGERGEPGARSRRPRCWIQTTLMPARRAASELPPTA